MKNPKEITSFSVYAYSRDIIREIIKSARYAREQNKPFHPEIFRKLYKAIDYLNYGQTNSRIFLIEYSEGEEFRKIIAKIRKDPWLHGTIIIVLAHTLSNCQCNSLIQLGVVDILFTNEIQYKLPTITGIINSNLTLFESQQFLSENTIRKNGRMILKNNISLVAKATNILMDFCYAAGFRNLQSYTRIALCLHEMISNAIEHGNCEIGYQRKSKFLQKTYSISHIVKKIASKPEYKDRKVTIRYQIDGNTAKITICDEGKGFQLQELPDPSEEEFMLMPHGRGILMTRNFADRMEYNSKGNEVALEFKNTSEIQATENELLKLGHGSTVHLAAGETLFEVGSESDYFYYILSGRLGVYINDKKIAESTPDEVFIGEMAFLHHNKRTGTVKALTPATLVPISRNGFIRMIKKYPYSGVFLARLLTRRLIKQNNAL